MIGTDILEALFDPSLNVSALISRYGDYHVVPCYDMTVVLSIHDPFKKQLCIVTPDFMFKGTLDDWRGLSNSWLIDKNTSPYTYVWVFSQSQLIWFTERDLDEDGTGK